MKVIEKGRAQKGWATETTCSGAGNGDGGCGARLLVEEADLFRTSAAHRDDIDWYITFKCVECGLLTDLKKVPSEVVARIKTRSKVQNYPNNGDDK